MNPEKEAIIEKLGPVSIEDYNEAYYIFETSEICNCLPDNRGWLYNERHVVEIYKRFKVAHDNCKIALENRAIKNARASNGKNKRSF